MITPDVLLDIAVSTSDFVLRDQALLAGMVMENQGVTETPVIGPFGGNVDRYKRGDRVIIKKGSKITSTSARLNRNAGRDYKVTLVGADRGTIYQIHTEVRVINSRVVWTSDGYWCYTDITNVVRCVEWNLQFGRDLSARIVGKKRNGYQDFCPVC